MIKVQNQIEFDSKVNAYMLSEASLEIREKAILELKRLNPEFDSVEKKSEMLTKMIKDGEADTDDMGGF